MPTRIDWLPYKIDQRARVLKSISETAAQNATLLGLSPEDVARMKAIAEEYDFAVRIYEENRVMLSALKSWRDSVISNERSKNFANERPKFNNSPMPAGTKLGLIAEFRKYVRRIKSSAGYEPVIGARLGVTSPNHEKKPLAELKPKIKAESLPGCKVRLSCMMQGMTAIQVEYQATGSEGFKIVAFLSRLPETITIEVAIPGQPETGLVRVRYLKGNDRVGLYSNMVPVQLFDV